MKDNDPYTKREQDEWRNEVRDQFSNIEKMLIDRSLTDEALIKSNAELAKIASHNSGQIIAIWKSIEENKEISKLIKDIIGFSKVLKWFVYLVIGMGALYAAIKTLSELHFGRVIDAIK